MRYRIVGEDDHIVVATTRPETILGDTAVCANPADERYKRLKGRKVIVPMVNRRCLSSLMNMLIWNLAQAVLKLLLHTILMIMK